jgi:L-histidine N-alpha-methyltransferase
MRRRLAAPGLCRTATAAALLIGVDLVKEVAVLEAAYDDPLGVTAAFNRNLLLHLNRLAGTDFDVPTGATSPSSMARITHRNASRSAPRTTVRWSGGERRFAEGERMHTENSYKWHRPKIRRAAATKPAFGEVRHWTDAQRLVRRLSGAAQA